MTFLGGASFVACALILHVLFNKLEHSHLPFLKYLLLILPILSLRSLSPTSILSAYIWTYTTLTLSIIIYRLSPIHPLARYPGPILARITKFWGLYHMTTGKFHLKFVELHRKYGDVVRVGPNEISIVNADVIQPVMGAKGMPKGPLFSGRTTPDSEEIPALICITDIDVHLTRRKVWNKAFSVGGMKAYEPILRARLEQVVKVLSAKSDGQKEVDLSKWISYLAYDFMGDMAFGAGFELMTNEDKDGLWNLLVDGLRMQAFTQHIPWATSMLYKIPGAKESAAKLTDFVINLANGRVARGKMDGGEGREDLSSYLLNEHPASESSVKLAPKEYMADTFLALVAGSDSVATALSCTLFYAISEKGVFQRLRQEIDEYYPRNAGVEPADDTSKLANMPYLNAVINESLRLQPPVPTCLQRGCDKNTVIPGLSIYIPKDTAIYIPPYVLHRDERYFSPSPEKFIPDRWLPSSSSSVAYTTTQSAYIPFSVGPMNCVGKLLGQLELRLVLATLVQKFDFEFKEGWDLGEWDRKLDDYFLFEKGGMPVSVRKRA